MKTASWLLSLVICNLSYADSLGRLFFSPQQRIAPTPATPETKIDQAPAPAIPSSYTLKINGFIESNLGTRTIWINQQRHQQTIDNTQNPLQLQLVDHIITLPLSTGQYTLEYPAAP